MKVKTSRVMSSLRQVASLKMYESSCIIYLYPHTHTHTRWSFGFVRTLSLKRYQDSDPETWSVWKVSVTSFLTESHTH